jgi:chemotaxis protein methyltransferase CheR
VSSEDDRGDVLDDATLSKVENVLREASGLTLAASVRRSLSTALQRAAESRKMDLTTFLDKLLAREQSVVASFVEYAVIGETYFFRHPEHLRELSREAMMAQGTAPFRVWSAGCATGEEPYSIVMSLVASGIPLERIKVTATDISSRALQRARAATYNPWSVRRIEPAMERRFLSVQNDVVTVAPQVCKPVEFLQHNLMMDAAPVSEQDAVFCRNVLIYFPQEVVRLVLVKLIGAIKPGGLLFLSPAEVPLTNDMGLEVTEIQNIPILRVPKKGMGEGGSKPSSSRRPKLDMVRKLMASQPVVSPPPPVSGPPPVGSTPATSPAPSPARPSGTRTTPAPVRFKVPAVPPPTRPPPASALAKPAEQPAPSAPPAAPPANLSPDDMLRQALAAAREGKYDQAEALAKEAAKKLVPEAYLLLAMVAEARGELTGAVDAVRKALYLDPKLALGHATLMTLYTQLDRREDAERARLNAMRAIEGLDDEHPLRGVETTMTVGVLRQALEARGRTR